MPIMAQVKISAIDVSHHQGKIDWEKVRDNGVKHCFIRAGYGKSTIDRQFKENIGGAAGAGLLIGVYWYSYAVSVQEAQEEAKRCIRAIEPYRDRISMPVFFDSEYEAQKKAGEAGVTDYPALFNDMAAEFCELVRKSGYRPGVYYNEDYLKHIARADRLRDYALWLAVYKADNPYPCDIWQYTPKGRLDGIAGDVDMNWILSSAIVPKRTPYGIAADCRPYRLNVRTQPGKAGRKIGAVRDGQRFTVHEEDAGWGRIEFGPGVYGWIDLGYTKKTE